MDVKKVVLAYSGGLDTSIIVKWLKDTYNCEIIAFAADVGQEEELNGLEEKAIKTGASKCYIEDLREEFVSEYVFPAIMANAIYEDRYLLGTSLARPVIAKKQVEIALNEGADALCHGATGKGNDQVRFELTFKALAPQLKVIAPWRIWDITSREQAIDYAQKHNVPLGNISKKNIYSRDWNIWHMSHEGGDLEDPWNRPKDEMFQLSKAPKEAPDKETEISIQFEKAIPIGLNGKKMKSLEILETLNRLGGENGIGRADVVETRVVGMKSRGVYETPAGTILNTALRELEMITCDADTLSMKHQLAIKYAELVYCGKWFTPYREALDAFMASASRWCSGSVRLVLYKGNIIIAGRKSDYSLYLQDLASFGESSYDHKDASGFINLYGLSTGVAAMVHKDLHAEKGQGPEIIDTAATFHEK